MELLSDPMEGNTPGFRQVHPDPQKVDLAIDLCPLH